MTYFANLSEEERNAIIQVPNLVASLRITFPNDFYDENIHVDKQMFDAVLNDDFELLVTPVNGVHVDNNQNYRKNAARLMLTSHAMHMLGCDTDQSKILLCKTLLPQLLEGNKFLDYSPEESEIRIRDYISYMGLNAQ
jgi:aspartyl/asparaginyl beta-hydroxylase (cupin superfamily)